MRKSKWTEAQIVAMLREHEQGRKVADICRAFRTLRSGASTAPR
jgi:hypothetical protein